MSVTPTLTLHGGRSSSPVLGRTGVVTHRESDRGTGVRTDVHVHQTGLALDHDVVPSRFSVRSRLSVTCNGMFQIFKSPVERAELFVKNLDAPEIDAYMSRSFIRQQSLYPIPRDASFLGTKFLTSTSDRRTSLSTIAHPSGCLKSMVIDHLFRLTARK